MNPIRGPFYEWNLSNPFVYHHRAVYKQAPPYNLNLPYGMISMFGESSWQDHTTYDDGAPASVTSGTAPIPNWDIRADPDYTYAQTVSHALAFEKLRAEVSDQASWGETLAQINKSRDLLNSGLVRLADAVMDIRRGDFIGAARSLNDSGGLSKASWKKGFSENFLAFEYGIKPLMLDCESSMKILSKDLGVRTVKGKGRHHVFRPSFTRNEGFSGLAWDSEKISIDYSLYTRLGAQVQVTNPNLHLYASMGFIDIALPWKLLPLSFVADWFINVEQFIGASSAFYGVGVSNAFTTYYARGSRSRNLNQYRRITAPGSTYTGWVSERQTCVFMSRATGIELPGLHIRPFRGLSLSRGAQAVALVLSMFGR